MKTRLILSLVLAAPFLSGQNLSDKLHAIRPSDVSAGEAAVLDNLERRAHESLAAIPRARTREQGDAARAGLRRNLEQSLGFRRLPWPPKLAARTVGVVRRDGYQIEKIIYETLPGVRVPAHLYIPDNLKAPAPAILFYNGHWWADSKTRPDFQAFHINMARLGFVVLTFDAFGQGERGISRRDHRRTEALLAGVSQQGFAVYETQCALEYLLSRKEADPKRIGMSGASGGGYNTWMTAALDERIAVAVPAVGTSEFYEQIHVCRPLDWYRANEHCHFVPGLIRYANNQELIAMIAPRPLMIVAAHKDQSFPVEGVREVYHYGQELYGSYGVPGKIGYSEDATTSHGYQQKKREAAYGWFLRWLMNKGDGSPFAEPPTETAPWDSAELRCFPVGQNDPAGPGFVEAAKRLARGLPPAYSADAVQEALGSLPPLLTQQPRIEKSPVQRLEIPSETGIVVPAFLLRPEGRERGVLVAAHDSGKEELAGDPLVQAALAGGWAVCGADPRGIGELAISKGGWAAAVSLLLGENFVWRQAFDLANVLAYLSASQDFAGKPAGLYGRGHGAALAVTLALAQPQGSRVKWYALRDGFTSFRQFIERPASLRESYKLISDEKKRDETYDREIPYHYFAFDVLRHFDLPQVLAAAKAKGLVVNPIDGDWNRMPIEVAKKLLPRGVRTVSAEDPDSEIRRFLSTQ